MSLLRNTAGSIRMNLVGLKPSLGLFVGNLMQTRNATKRVSGSKTNKNDSAGRRLGPKVYESHFVRPGQIIMRQRGTKIHPGENTGIGKDHTIFALEPGYVRFYYDPFHPLRKYVGVALSKDLTLPSPHFAPRIRRFGYVEIADPVEAEKEENHMSRQEYLQQPEIQKAAARNQNRDQKLLEEFSHSLSLFLDIAEEDVDVASKKLLDIYKLTKLGQSVEDATLQATFNYIYDLQLQLNRGDISSTQFAELKQKFSKLSSELSSKVTVGLDGKLCAYLNPEQRLKQRENILEELKNLENKLLTKEERQRVQELIYTPLIFANEEKSILLKQYLPSVLPETVEGTVVKDLNTKKVPKGITVIRKFDNASRKVHVLGRTKDAFLH